ncbi:hypothetical protein [Pedobacter sp.]
MRHSLIFLTIIGLLYSCNQSDKKTVVHDKAAQAQHNDTAVTSAERKIIIKELKRLQVIFTAIDKEKVADIFGFPISEENLGIYIDNSSFNENLKKNSNKITRSMFISSYYDISESLQIDQISHR